jgi:hypothetical protein
LVCPQAFQPRYSSVDDGVRDVKLTAAERRARMPLAFSFPVGYNGDALIKFEWRGNNPWLTNKQRIAIGAGNF